MDLLKSAEQIYSAALSAVSPDELVRGKVAVKRERLIISGRKFDLSKFRDIYIVSFGKSAPAMAETVLEILRGRVKSGVFLSQECREKSLPPLVCMQASHPLPDLNSIRAAKEILSLAKKIKKDDLLIALISGGGSSQICLPPKDVSLEEKRKTIKGLLLAGANIRELNAVRKHISLIKGGRLAEAAFPASVISILISDVIENELETIASGPTYWDSSTYETARDILNKYGLWETSPDSVRKIVKRGILGLEDESVKKGDPVLRRTYNFVIGDNKTALTAAAERASLMGFEVLLLSSFEDGEARERAKDYVASLLRVKEKARMLSRPICLLSGGEFTVTVRGRGKGGRNQEFVLAFLREAARLGIKEGDWIILSLGTDGIDGPTDAAGAWATNDTLNRAEELCLEPDRFLANNDSYHFFKKTGGLLMTGPTGTNVMDIRILIVK
jgi:glycerate 2-kinase